MNIVMKIWSLEIRRCEVTKSIIQRTEEELSTLVT